MIRSYLVTGGGWGIGRALIERLLGDDSVSVIELDPSALAWTESHPAAGPHVISVVGNASEEAVAEHAADLAQCAGSLAGLRRRIVSSAFLSNSSGSMRDV
jgi:NAD(P)-dependent dehydrogenase (short-subunit alcohol dehydrogenase family)